MLDLIKTNYNLNLTALDFYIKGILAFYSVVLVTDFRDSVCQLYLQTAILTKIYETNFSVSVK